jgi:hypothetical protein
MHGYASAKELVPLIKRSGPMPRGRDVPRRFTPASRRRPVTSASTRTPSDAKPRSERSRAAPRPRPSTDTRPIAPAGASADPFS